MIIRPPNLVGLAERARVGRGPHFCLGSSLSRAESRIALATLLTRTRDLRLDPDGPPRQRVPSYILRGVTRLDVLFGAR